jgi:hypothetical protein
MIKREELTNPESCMSRARADEMTFVLLGRDTAAPVAIRAWVAERVRLGKNTLVDPQILEALECAEVMRPGSGSSPLPWYVPAWLSFTSDPDIVCVDGIKCSREIFTHLADRAKEGTTFQLVKTENGVVTIRELRTKLSECERVDLHALMQQWGRDIDIQFSKVVKWIESR